MSKKKDTNALQWTKTLRDLIELRNVQLDKIKAHLLGREETGAMKEPEDYWGENQQVEFERYFKNQLSPWTADDLKLECEDCHLKCEDVSNRYFSHPYPESDENLDLCEKCYDKRTVESIGESEDTDPVKPASKGDVRVMLQTAPLQIKVLKTFPIDQRIVRLEELLANKFEVAPGMEPAYDAYRAVLQKELDSVKTARGDHETQT